MTRHRLVLGNGSEGSSDMSTATRSHRTASDNDGQVHSIFTVKTGSPSEQWSSKIGYQWNDAGCRVRSQQYLGKNKIAANKQAAEESQRWAECIAEWPEFQKKLEHYLRV